MYAGRGQRPDTLSALRPTDPRPREMFAPQNLPQEPVPTQVCKHTWATVLKFGVMFMPLLSINSSLGMDVYPGSFVPC